MKVQLENGSAMEVELTQEAYSTGGSFPTMNDDGISSAAAQMGRKGGRSRSAAKVAAVRENGKKGGRPRGHRHHAVSETLMPYIGYSVGDDENRRPGQTKINPMAHGSITWRYECSCGAQKIENHNGGQIESSGWFKEM